MYSAFRVLFLENEYRLANELRVPEEYNTQEKVNAHLIKMLGRFRKMESASKAGRRESSIQPKLIRTWVSELPYGLNVRYANTHRAALEYVLKKHKLGKVPRELIDRAQQAIDQEKLTGAFYAWLHAMQGVRKDDSAYQSQATVKERHRLWIAWNQHQAQLEFAKAKCLPEGDERNAAIARGLMHFGFALHSLQDMTSPAHVAQDAPGKPITFRKYKDTDDIIKHANKEDFTPLGKDSNLVAATRALFQTTIEGKSVGRAYDTLDVDQQERPKGDPGEASMEVPS